MSRRGIVLIALNPDGSMGQHWTFDLSASDIRLFRKIIKRIHYPSQPGPLPITPTPRATVKRRRRRA